MKNDSLGNRMKMYEKMVTGTKFMPYLPVVARLDGKAFHSWTKGLDKPFDLDFMNIMKSVTKGLVEATGATLGYTQSDEISLVFYTSNRDSQIFFDGKIFKMTSVLASMTTALFAEKLFAKCRDLKDTYVEDAEDTILYGMQMHKRCQQSREKCKLLISKPSALFDCRVWQLPTKDEVFNYIVWREQDAVRNSIQSAGQAFFSHKDLNKKSQNDIQEMLCKQKGVNWNDYSASEKRGTYYQKCVNTRKFTVEETSKLPPKHEAHSNPELTVSRTDIRELLMDRFTRVFNKEGVVFCGEGPLSSGCFIPKGPPPPPPPPPRIIREGSYRTKEELISAGKQGWRKRCAQFFMMNKRG